MHRNEREEEGGRAPVRRRDDRSRHDSRSRHEAARHDRSGSRHGRERRSNPDRDVSRSDRRQAHGRQHRCSRHASRSSSRSNSSGRRRSSSSRDSGRRQHRAHSPRRPERSTHRARSQDTSRGSSPVYPYRDELAEAPAAAAQPDLPAPEPDPALDFLSAQFDALRALLTPGLQPPNTRVRMHEAAVLSNAGGCP